MSLGLQLVLNHGIHFLFDNIVNHPFNKVSKLLDINWFTIRKGLLNSLIESTFGHSIFDELLDASNLFNINSSKCFYLARRVFFTLDFEPVNNIFELARPYNTFTDSRESESFTNRTFVFPQRLLIRSIYFEPFLAH